MQGGYITRLRTWAQAPFTTSGDLVNWTLTLIVFITIAVLWQRVLSHIVER
jgi:hypothetical protein